MAAYGPKKRRFSTPAMFLALAVLGGVLALLLTLLYLLYWMRAPAPLPDPARLLIDRPDAFLIVKPDISDPDSLRALRRLLDAALRDPPETVRTLARYGLTGDRAERTPVLVTYSVRAPSDRPWRWVGTVSLGRFRGAFWLADRALHRKAKSGDIPYGIRPHRDLTLYEATRSSRAGLEALGIWRATGLAGSDLEALSQVCDVLENQQAPTETETPDLGGHFGRGRIVRPDAFLSRWFAHLPGGGEYTASLAGSVSRIEIEVDAREGGDLLARAECPWSEGVDRERAANAAREIFGWLRSQGWVGQFAVETGENALRLEVEVTLPEEKP